MSRVRGQRQGAGDGGKAFEGGPIELGDARGDVIIDGDISHIVIALISFAVGFVIRFHSLFLRMIFSKNRCPLFRIIVCAAVSGAGMAM